MAGAHTLGGLNYDDIHARGVELDLSSSHGSRSISSETFSRGWAKLSVGSILPGDFGLAARLVAGTTSSSSAENAFSIGGLKEVRGFYDGEFCNKSAWFGNLELRKNLVKFWSIIFQPAIFVDGGAVASGPSDWGSAPVRKSAGGGFRFLPEDIHLVALRFDYAQTFGGTAKGGGFSFGLEQFL